jgi:hypothetical protein
MFVRDQRRRLGQIGSSLREQLEGRRPRRLAATRDINHIDLYLVQSNDLPNYLPSNFKLQTK